MINHREGYQTPEQKVYNDSWGDNTVPYCSYEGPHGPKRSLIYPHLTTEQTKGRVGGNCNRIPCDEMIGNKAECWNCNYY